MSEISTDSFSPLLHQVAGCHSGIPSNILINRTGQIFKPYKLISNPTFTAKDDDDEDLVPVTLNELQFYEKLNQSTDKDFLALKALAPKYYGSFRIKEIDHLILEDYTSGMKYPCVMDIKLGKDRNYPGRLKEKSYMDSIKYPCLQEFGFCLSGIKLWNPSTDEVQLHLMPKTTRQFSSNEVKKYIKMYLMCENNQNEGVLCKKMLEGVEGIYNWISQQRSFVFRGSSLLFVYDAAASHTKGEEEVKDLRARVGMIDFAHIFHSYGARDDNYYNGIKNLCEFIRTCEE